MHYGNGVITYDYKQPHSTIYISDRCRYAIGAALCQDHGNWLQPCAHRSRKMNDHERNYPVHEQELLSIIDALREWRHYLVGNKFVLITDHRSLQYLSTQ